MFPLEITAGVFTFEYNLDDKRLYVHYGDRRAAGWVQDVTEEDWLALYNTIAEGEAVSIRRGG